MSSTADRTPPPRFVPKFHPRVLGTAAPVFPGFEVDILERIPDAEREDAVWHRERAKAMIKAHPEIKELFGNDATTAFWCLAAAGTQLVLALAVSRGPWWVALLTAYFIGSSINVMLFQLGHECVHGLVFKRPFWNRMLFTVTTLPMFLSGHHTWWPEHLVHHTDMGAKKDFISRRRTFFLATRLTSPLFLPYSLFMLVTQVARSIVGLFMYVGGSLLRGRLKPGKLTLAVLSDEHLVSGYEREGFTLWAVGYPLLNLAVCGALLAIGGWKSLVYLLASQAFFTGFLQPYSLGWVLGISHFHGARRYQPTASHYGWLVNLASFNAGLHVEHHDLMTIPWRRLPKLRRIAAEFYDDLETIPSYTWLALQFVFAGPRFFEENFNHEAHRIAARLQPSNDSLAATTIGRETVVEPYSFHLSMGAMRREIAVALVYVGLLTLLLIAAPAFYRGDQFRAILVASSPTLIAAIGMTPVILSRNIDISIGSQFSLCGILAGLMAQSGWPMPLVALGSILVGSLLGAINGGLIAGLGLPSIVVTLATMVIWRESLRWWREGEFVRGLPASFQWFGCGQDAGQWLVIGISVLIAVLFGWSLRNLAAGRAVYATGSNPEAAFLAGIRPQRIIFSVFVLMGGLCGLAAVLHSVRFAAVDPTAGTGLELQVIAAVVVGGVAISGGRGTLLGAALGVLLLTTIRPALVFLGAEAHWEKAIQGAIILLAVAADAIKLRRGAHVSR